MISELVSNSIDEINKYRIERFNPDDESGEMEEDEDNDKSREENAFGTVINKDDNDGNFATMLISKDTIKNDTIQDTVLVDEKKEAPEFMKYINEMDISYDEFKLETDLYQQMEKRRKGNDDDLRALNLMDEEKYPKNDNGTMNVDKDDVSSENSQSIIKNKKNDNNYSSKNNLYDSQVNHNISNNNISNNNSEMLEKKSFVDCIQQEDILYKQYYNPNFNGRKLNFDEKTLKNESISPSKEHNTSTMKMNLNLPLMLNPQNLLKKNEKIDLKELNELLEDNELKSMGVTTIEETVKNSYISLDKEIEQIKASYMTKIIRYETAIEFLKINPHLKNLKEYEDYSKFSKFLDQSKFSAYSNKSGFDESIGACSLLPLNTIKVNKYKDNNINFKK